MWIVKNAQDTTLRLEDLGLEVSPGDYLDLDALGRKKVEASRDLQAALESGRLVSQVKSEDETRRLLEPQRGSDLFDELERKLKASKDALVGEIAAIAAGASGSGESVPSMDTSRLDGLLSDFSDSAIAELKNTVARAERLSQPSRPVAETAEEDVEEGPDVREESPSLRTEFDAFRRLLEEFETLKDMLRSEVQGLVTEFRKVKSGAPPAPEPAKMPRKRSKLTEADFRARAAIIDDIERELKKNFDNIGSKVKKQKDRTDLVDKLREL